MADVTTTIDEETGLTGASSLAPDMLTGRILLNVDSEEEGVLTIGCAGGSDAHLYLPVRRTAAPDGSVAAWSVAAWGSAPASAPAVGVRPCGRTCATAASRAAKMSDAAAASAPPDERENK